MRTVPNSIWRKAYLAFLLIFLSSCCKPCRQWTYQQVVTCCPSFNSACIIFDGSKATNGLEVELTKNAGGIQMHLNVHSLPIPPCPDAPERALVMVSIDGVEFTEHAFWLQGGQRLLLTEETRQRIVEALFCNRNIEIRVSRYKTCLVSDNFEQLYNRLCNLRVSF